MNDYRKPCREGHFDCIGRNSKDTRCSMDPSRCARAYSGGAGRHLPDFDNHRAFCARCGKDLK